MKLKALSLVLGAAFLLPSTGAVAAPQQGVKCPTGAESRFNNGVLKCIKVERKRAYSKCTLNAPHMQRVRGGNDLCHKGQIPVFGTKVGFGNDKVESVPFAAPGDGNGWVRVVDGHPDTIGTDIFTKTVRKYVHPAGAIYTHDARRGVQCRSGYETSFQNGRMKCIKVEVRASACWGAPKLDVTSDRDHCALGPVFMPTVPYGKATSIGYRLYINGGRGIRDVWKKTNFKYPSAR